MAILLVVLFHAHARGFEAGFIGVDVFFVISAFSSRDSSSSALTRPVVRTVIRRIVCRAAEAGVWSTAVEDYLRWHAPRTNAADNPYVPFDPVE